MVRGCSRGYRAGMTVGRAIKEMADMMYNKRTKSNFYKGLNKIIEAERDG